MRVVDYSHPPATRRGRCWAYTKSVPDPLAAVGRMAVALRPGGVLIAEEADFSMAGYSGHPDAGWATEGPIGSEPAM